MILTLELNLPIEDYNILEKYNFYYEKNIETYLKEMADHIRKAESEVK